ncbi:MAG: hypothetical protein KDA78_15475, partial [Planctomycetaceae bacterium]|nr:hypothetical protein [Planctomycetaceae bacterium]
YLCQVCGEPVKSIVESSLYLRYVLGEVQLNELFSRPECHLKCEPDLSRLIRHEKYGHLSREPLAADEEALSKRVTSGWLRLREVVQRGIPITEYPLPSKD